MKVEGANIFGKLSLKQFVNLFRVHFWKLPKFFFHSLSLSFPFFVLFFFCTLATCFPSIEAHGMILIILYNDKVA